MRRNPNFYGTSPSLTTLFCWDRSIAPDAGVKVDPTSSPSIFKCPSDSIERSTVTNGGRCYSVPMVSLGGNNDFALVKQVLAAGGSEFYRGRHLASVPVPTETILVAERPLNSNLFGEFRGAFVYCAQTDSASTYGTYTEPPAQPWASLGFVGGQERGLAGKQIHFDGWNYLFCNWPR